MADVKKIATREGYGTALVELGKEHADVVVLDERHDGYGSCFSLHSSERMHRLFRRRYELQEIKIPPSERQLRKAAWQLWTVLLYIAFLSKSIWN